MGSQVYTSGSGSFEAPITGDILVKVWAGGGGGYSGGLGGGGGGGGMAYATYSATVGDLLGYIVGGGGSAGSPGGDTYVTDPGSSYIAFASPGQPGDSSSGGSPGSVNLGLGYNGGWGAAPDSGMGGGGGSGAGYGNYGNDGSGSTGGAGVSEFGGAGGDGATSGSAGNGSVYGGGGGGANGTFTTGGSGAGGRIEFVWDDTVTFDETMSGGAVVGGSATYVYNTVAAGGAVAGGSAVYGIPTTITPSGGCLCGGSAVYGLTLSELMAGGVVCGGEYIGANYEEVGAGGAVVGSGAESQLVLNVIFAGGVIVGGRAHESVPITQITCACNEDIIEGSGGAVLGGSADVSDTSIRGGCLCGGSARVEVLQDTYDGLEAIWPLDEDGGPYLDRGRHDLDGEAGDLVHELVDGVFCLGAQQFTALEDGTGPYIVLPADTLHPVHAFTVSCWLQTQELYRPRTFYSRGFQDEDGNEWQFALGYGYLNHLVATIQTVDADGVLYRYEAFSDEQMTEDKFYHCAAVWNPGVGLQCFLNGSGGDVFDVPEVETATSTAGGYFGRWNIGSYPTGILQEVRLWPECKSEPWLQAEHDNFCSSGFYVVGVEELA
jgi:hypothetical protein